MRRKVRIVRGYKVQSMVRGMGDQWPKAEWGEHLPEEERSESASLLWCAWASFDISDW